VQRPNNSSKPLRYLFTAQPDADVKKRSVSYCTKFPYVFCLSQQYFCCFFFHRWQHLETSSSCGDDPDCRTNTLIFLKLQGKSACRI